MLVKAVLDVMTYESPRKDITLIIFMSRILFIGSFLLMVLA